MLTTASITASATSAISSGPRACACAASGRAMAAAATMRESGSAELGVSEAGRPWASELQRGSTIRATAAPATRRGRKAQHAGTIAAGIGRNRMAWRHRNQRPAHRRASPAHQPDQDHADDRRSDARPRAAGRRRSPARAPSAVLRRRRECRRRSAPRSRRRGRARRGNPTCTATGRVRRVGESRSDRAPLWRTSRTGAWLRRRLSRGLPIGSAK